MKPALKTLEPLQTFFAEMVRTSRKRVAAYRERMKNDPITRELFLEKERERDRARRLRRKITEKPEDRRQRREQVRLRV